MTIQEVVARFNTTPFLFAGSGITRRYYHLPNWVELLTHFANVLKRDEFAFRSYESQIPAGTNEEDRLPVVATLIEQDFNRAWFANADGVRSGAEGVFASVSAGTSPFKAEIAVFIQSMSSVDEAFANEVEKLKQISQRNLSGVITTNYDCFFEDAFDGYRAFIGQDELVFSQLQGIAEIYKIHGSVTNPSSIVIDQEDYNQFRKKGKYLAAKLMTIFMEYPIIFIGYSLSDSDIQSILADVVECLPSEKVSLLQRRFVFVEYKPMMAGADVSGLSMTFNGKSIEMTRITLADFGLLYDALSSKRAALPVKILRRFKDELYTFALTREPGPTMQVAPLDDKRIDENTLALMIGMPKTGLYGLGRAVEPNHWYRNVVLHDSPYPIDQMLEIAYPSLLKSNSAALPIWYYIRHATTKHDLAMEKAPRHYSDIVTDTCIDRNRSTVRNRTAIQIWNDEKDNLPRALRLLSNLPENKAPIEEIESILMEIFDGNPDILEELNGSNRSALRKLIRIYDYSKYGNNKAP